jgi:hypothetical protein
MQGFPGRPSRRSNSGPSASPGNSSRYETVRICRDFEGVPGLEPTTFCMASSARPVGSMRFLPANGAVPLFRCSRLGKAHRNSSRFVAFCRGCVNQSSTRSLTRGTGVRRTGCSRCPTVASTGSGYSMSKAIRSSRRPRRGAGWWLRTTMAPRAGAEIEQPDCVAGGVAGPSSSHRAHVPGWLSRWGRGSARPHSGRSRDVRPGRRFAPAFARGCGRRHRPRRRARVSSVARARKEPVGTPASVG